MQCHVCNAEVGDGQKFCHECGQSLAGVTDATQELDVIPDGPGAEPGDSDGALRTTATRTTTPNDGGGDRATDADTATGPMDTLPNPAVDDPADTQPIEVTTAKDDLAATQPIDATASAPRLPDPADTQPIDVVVARSDSPPDLASTRPNPVVGAPDPAGDTVATETAAAATAGGTPGGRIGASLFDPDTAPPDADHEWDGGIPPLDDDMFASNPATTESAAQPRSAHEATTTIPIRAPYDAAADLGPTGQHAAVYDREISAPLLEGEIQPFRLRPSFVLAILGLAAAVMASLADVFEIRTDRVVDGIVNRTATIDDVGGNLAIAGFVGAAAMLLGGFLHCFHLRWGAGLAGGAGLALIGWAALTLGLVEDPIAEARRTTRDPSTPGEFTLTITRDLGYWLIVAVAAIGLIVFVVSLSGAGTGGHRGLNPWTAALGAVASLVVAAGPLITVNGANFDVNFDADDLSRLYLLGRLVQLGSIVLSGVVGFLLVRTYGLGLVLGGLSVPFWMWLSSQLQLGEPSIGIGSLNLRSSSTTPHAVTTTGVALASFLLLLAAVLAVVQHAKRRRT